MRVYIGLGSNLGDRRSHLRRGIRALASRGLAPVALSGVWETAPLGCREPHRFLNMVAGLETERSPSDILAELMQIELGAGRVRGGRNEPRPLDLDLLLVGDRRVELPHLVVPHPRMWGRRFVLAPLSELAPSLRHPGNGRRVADLERELRAEQPDVARLGTAPDALDPRLSANL